MSQTTNSMNFLPEDYVEKRQAARAAVVFIGLLVVVVGGIVGTWAFVQWRADRIFTELDHKRQEYEQASKDLAELQQLQDEKARMVSKAELSMELMERVRRSTLLEAITTLQPKGVSLKSFELKSRELPSTTPPLTDLEKAKLQQDGKPIPPPKPPEMEVTLDLVGYAGTDSQVAQYISALGKSPLLTDVNLLFSEEFKLGSGNDADTVRRFHVDMKLNRNADLRGLASAN